MTHCAYGRTMTMRLIYLDRKTVLLGVSGVLETQRKEEHMLCCH